MEYPIRKHPRLRAYDYSQNGGYFITICTRSRAPLFWDAPGVLSPTGEIASGCLREIPAHIQGVLLDEYCVMPDHIHVILLLENVGPPYMAAVPPPPEPSEAGSAGRRRDSGVSEPWRLRRGEGYKACPDEKEG